ncbi:ferredoxin [Jatrophihabitans sp.]|uniref:ferredoxin n=1 Tax=Jatrophihabitans sp. TaxID=1932789 RepID=UPI0030C695E4
MTIDSTKCQGHAVCLTHSPETFDFDDVAGKAFVVVADVAPEHEDHVRRAEANCPERAIEIV